MVQDTTIIDSNTGSFALSVDLPTGTTLLPTLGFLLEGRNANPDVPRGEIQIKDIVANWTEIGNISENFTKTPYFSQ